MVNKDEETKTYCVICSFNKIKEEKFKKLEKVDLPCQNFKR